MFRYKITIEYNGTSFFGWQKQEAFPTIQSEIEAAIFTICRQDISVFAAGRTDTGVHARGQVAHFDLETYKDPEKLLLGMNHFLVAKLIAITDINVVSPDFHARFSAISRQYKYEIIYRKTPPVLANNLVWHVKKDLDIELMKQGSAYLIGKHDFAAFRASECQAKSPIRTMTSIDIYRNGNKIIMSFKAKSFLHKQIRSIVGTLKKVGEGHSYPDFVKTVLDSKKRSLVPFIAPPYGLYFEQVTY